MRSIKINIASIKLPLLTDTSSNEMRELVMPLAIQKAFRFLANVVLPLLEGFRQQNTQHPHIKYN